MRFRPLLCVVVLARMAAAQAPEASPEAPRSTVTGVVHDSIARAPLAGAIVQLVGADSLARVSRTTTSDSLGSFAFAGVPAGRYMLGFFHHMLDSLGVEPLLREVYVGGQDAVRADLAIPSSSRLRATICGVRSATDTGTLVLGIVRDARTHVPATDAAVLGVWVELSFRPEGVRHHVPQLMVTTAQNGWFAMCHVPSAGTIALMANRGGDSTHLIEVEIPAERFMRRDLYLGPAHGAEGRLTGVVTTAVGGPVAGAQISIRDGPETRANEQGEWTLTNAPLGTRMLEVRAVGFHPQRLAVDVVAGAPPILTALSTMKAVLDTVTVTAARVRDQNIIDFLQRRRNGNGRYITAEDVARRRPVVTSDLFRVVPGMRVERTGLGETQIQMRGTFEELCFPGVYIDGQFMRDLSADDIDTWVNPNEVGGIEIYTGPGTPVQFTPGMAGGGLAQQVCGSIVIWTKPLARAPRASWKARVAKVVGLGAIVLGIRAIT
jgi:hypothetical protein